MGASGSVKTAASLFDLGILFVLFMGGMEVDMEAIKHDWKRVLINGLGQILLNFGLFTGLGVVLFRDAGLLSLLYFGLCCTLSSTILVLGCLKKRGEMEQLHGQVMASIVPQPCRCSLRTRPPSRSVSTVARHWGHRLRGDDSSRPSASAVFAIAHCCARSVCSAQHGSVPRPVLQGLFARA